MVEIFFLNKGNKSIKVYSKDSNKVQIVHSENNEVKFKENLSLEKYIKNYNKLSIDKYWTKSIIK